MKEELIKAVLAQGTSAIGQFVRWWLLSLAVSAGGLTVQMMHDGTGIVLAFSVAVVMTATMVAIPAALVVAIAFVAVKF